MNRWERLEEIKKELELDWSDISYVVNQDDVKWLINRVEELGEENDELVERVHKLALDWSELVDENNELAERVGELEKEVSDWRAEVQKWQKFYKESEENHLETKELLKNLVNQNKRYREALKFYADDKSWEFDWLDDIRKSLIWQDYGEKARQALGREE